MSSIGRSMVVVLVSASLLVASGCGCEGGTGAGIVVKGPGSPAPSGYTVDVSQQRADRATLVSEDLVPLVAQVTLEGHHSMGPLSLCTSAVWVRGWSGSQSFREWESGKNTAEWTLVTHAVRAYGDLMSEPAEVLSGAVVVAARKGDTCETYPSREGTPHLTGELELPPLAGVDAQYVVCERIDRPGSKVWGSCVALLAKDEIVSRLRVRTTSEKSAKDLIRRLAPVAAQRLVGAVSAPVSSSPTPAATS